MERGTVTKDGHCAVAGAAVTIMILMIMMMEEKKEVWEFQRRGRTVTIVIIMADDSLFPRPHDIYY